MNLLPVFILAFLLALLPAVVIGAGSPLPISTMPETVSGGSEAVQFLWNQVQNGVFGKWLPEKYEYAQGDWNDFMHTDAEALIHHMYRLWDTILVLDHDRAGTARSSGYQEFLDLTKYQNHGEYKMGETDHKSREMAEILVKEFARKQLKRPYEWPEVQSRNQEPGAEDLRKATRRRQRWGKSLGLASSSTSPK